MSISSGDADPAASELNEVLLESSLETLGIIAIGGPRRPIFDIPLKLLVGYNTANQPFVPIFPFLTSAFCPQPIPD